LFGDADRARRVAAAGLGDPQIAEQLGAARQFLDALFEQGNALFVPLAALVEIGQQQIGLVIFAVKRQAVQIGGFGLAVFAARQMGVAFLVPQMGGVGAELDGPVVVGDAAIQHLLLQRGVFRRDIRPRTVEPRQVGGVVGVERVDALGL